MHVSPRPSEMAEALTHAALEADVDLQRFKARKAAAGSRSRIKPPKKSGSRSSQAVVSRQPSKRAQVQNSETLASAPSPISHTTSVQLPTASTRPSQKIRVPESASLPDVRDSQPMPWWAALLAVLGLVGIGFGVYALREARGASESKQVSSAPQSDEAVPAPVADTQPEAEDEEAPLPEETKALPSHGAIVLKPDPAEYGQTIEFVAIPTIETRNDKAVRFVIRDDSGWRRTIDTKKDGTHYEGSRRLFRAGRYTVALEGFEPPIERSFQIERPQQAEYGVPTVTRTWDAPAATTTTSSSDTNTAEAIKEPENINWGVPTSKKGTTASSGSGIDWTIPE